MYVKPYLLVPILLLVLTQLHAQKLTISGYIRDAASGEPLISANIFDERSASGAVTNTYGFFSLTLPKDSVSLAFSYIGYSSQYQSFYLRKDTTINVSLGGAVELQVVEVVGASQGARIEERTQMSQVVVPVEQIKRVPALLGEVDVLKALQLLPGVQSGGEGQNGLYVRGGSPDQNLVLLDGVPVYNVSHLLGIFSVFNADAIKNVTLTKGGFPARYGGRLSSILEINMKEGNLQEWHGEGSLGLISSKLTLEGPLVKDKTSLLISGRRTYADLLFGPIIRATQEEGTDLRVKLFFYDLNAKLQHKINDKHRLYLSAYLGSDVFSNRYEETDVDYRDLVEGGIDWGNMISAFRWNYQINNKLFANTTLTYSRFDVDIFAAFDSEYGNEREVYSAKYFSGIEDLAAKVDIDFIPNPNHYIRFGGSLTNHKYSPGALAFKAEFEEERFDTLVGSQNAYSNELALYVEDDIQLGALKANIGVHSSAFNVEGTWYTSVQPRLGLRYLLSNDLSIKASYSTMTQFINLLTSESFSLPTDLWVPSTKQIKPQESWQTALGVAKTFGEAYEVSLEGYYKSMENVISYREGASFLFGLENDWQDKITQGDGEAYGLEFFVQKKKGRFSGWIGYTLSWNWRQFDEINGGQRFPFRYDRRHDISIVANYDFSPTVGFSAAWVYGTGNAVTLNTFRYPTEVYAGDGFLYGYNDVESGGSKNAFRMTDYHRLDVSLEIRKIKPKWEEKWVIGAYNAYYHRNPYYIIADEEATFDQNGNLIKTERVFKEISILPIIPSISYQFKF
ncbi:MAG TPA: TonB-dependent receptor plug domain-containing protein [Saprospiraceae bacterium]|mgnify:CR=1 FL=1|nr:TonB-dependent receptor plug domain-containing protein [Saprospiraceae bacterium]HMQ83391.1 TonB-dependent receptor plug domain-containing protein [Saprospiraceae bacterium]